MIRSSGAAGPPIGPSKKKLGANMQRRQVIRSVVGFVVGLGGFLGIAWPLKAGLARAGVDSAAVGQVALKGTMIAVALAGWALSGRPLAAMGWRRAGWRRDHVGWFAVAGLAMMAASVAMIFLEVRHPVAAQLGFLQIVGLIWGLSSVSEEVYVRGLIQSWVADRPGPEPEASPFEPAVVSSALLFAAMHAPLMGSDAGVAGGLAIVLATLVVGWACAALRARSGSLWPAIACHVVGNVAAIPGGIVAVILYRILHGRLPEIVSGSG